jgi:hypothetical protein
MGADTDRGTASSSSATRALEPPSMSAVPAHRSLAHFLAPGPAAGGDSAFVSQTTQVHRQRTFVQSGSGIDSVPQL